MKIWKWSKVLSSLLKAPNFFQNFKSHLDFIKRRIIHKILQLNAAIITRAIIKFLPLDQKIYVLPASKLSIKGEGGGRNWKTKKAEFRRSQIFALARDNKSPSVYINLSPSLISHYTIFVPTMGWECTSGASGAHIFHAPFFVPRNFRARFALEYE